MSHNSVPCLNCLYLFSQADKDKGNFKKLIDAVKESNSGKSVGEFSKDKFPGDFMTAWRNELDSAKFERVGIVHLCFIVTFECLTGFISVQIDISSALAYVMAPKEESEVMVVKKACQASMDLFNKYLKEQLMDLIDKDKVCCKIFYPSG